MKGYRLIEGIDQHGYYQAIQWKRIGTDGLDANDWITICSYVDPDRARADWFKIKTLGTHRVVVEEI